MGKEDAPAGGVVGVGPGSTCSEEGLEVRDRGAQMGSWHRALESEVSL